MKTVKKLLLSALAIVMLISLSSCVIVPSYKRYNNINTDEVESVEIYDLRDAEAEDRTFLETDAPIFDIEEESIEDFFEDLGQIRFEDHLVFVLIPMDPVFSYGEWVVRINYTDGSYTLISDRGFGETYDDEGECIERNHYGCESEEWLALIGKYVPEEIFESEAVTDEEIQDKTA